MNLTSLLRGVLGLCLILGIAFLFSNNRRRISWRLVGTGIVIQVVFAVFILYSDTLKSWFAPLGWPKALVSWLGGVVVSLLNFTAEGSKFVFGRLAANSGPDSLGVFFAFQVLPTIIFVATLTSVLYYLGILQAVVKGMAWIMAKLMGTSGAESLSNTANIFVGQTEAPLLIKPYIGSMTKSEILTIMVGGMATIAGGVMAAYIQMLGQAMADVQKIPLAEAQIRFAVQLLVGQRHGRPGLPGHRQDPLPGNRHARDQGHGQAQGGKERLQRHRSGGHRSRRRHEPGHERRGHAPGLHRPHRPDQLPVHRPGRPAGHQRLLSRPSSANPSPSSSSWASSCATWPSGSACRSPTPSISGASSGPRSS